MNNDIIKLVIDRLNQEDLWFTTKTDPTWEEPADYYKLDEYGDLSESSVKQIIKEVTNLLGDGAVELNDAVELWLQDAMSEYKVAYKDSLVTKFKDKPVVDGIDAFENSVQLAESKTLKTESDVERNNAGGFYKDNKYYLGNPDGSEEDYDAVEYVGDDTEDLWTAVVCGDDKYIQNYYDNGGKSNVRYERFGSKNSLIMGALRNGNFDTFNLLKSHGETILKSEVDEYKSIMAKKNYEDEISKSAKDENKTVNTKDKVNESFKRRLKEENNKSANLISDMFKAKDFDADSEQGQIVMRTSELFNALSDKGYDVQVSFDNGESTNAILLGQQGGQVIITIDNTNQPLKAFASGNFEVNKDNLDVLTDIQEQISAL